jgi:DNA invertase Pin-like site-specific DNA recombinase
MKIAVYARVSTLNKGQDVDMQLIDMRKSIESKGWSLFKEYVDRGVSGSRSSRPQLDKLMRDAADKKFDAVLVWKLDRFGRSVRHLVNAIAELESFGVAFISLKDSIDLTTAQGRLMFQIIAAMAEFERELIRERVKAGMANARTKGKQIGRPSLGINRNEIVALKATGATWDDVSAALFCSVATAKRAYGSSVDSITL